jgi:hypothetical protein
VEFYNVEDPGKERHRMYVTIHGFLAEMEAVEAWKKHRNLSQALLKN